MSKVPPEIEHAFRVKDSINKIIEQCDFATAHRTITDLRGYMDARAEQVRPDEDDGSDLV